VISQSTNRSATRSRSEPIWKKGAQNPPNPVGLHTGPARMRLAIAETSERSARSRQQSDRFESYRRPVRCELTCTPSISCTSLDTLGLDTSQADGFSRRRARDARLVSHRRGPTSP
jgi:hypothetical protein